MKLSAVPRRAEDEVFYWPTHRFSVAQYLRMVETGILGPNDKVELLEGYVVPKMARNPPHDCSLSKIGTALVRRLPEEWVVRQQSVLVLSDSVPEPDIAVVPGPPDRYAERHPRAREAALVLEVSHSSIVRDLTDKLRIYARSRCPQYWVVNLVEGVVEVFSQPRGGRSPGYALQASYGPVDEAPLALGGTTFGTVPVRALLP